MVRKNVGDSVKDTAKDQAEKLSSKVSDKVSSTINDIDTEKLKGSATEAAAVLVDVGARAAGGAKDAANQASY